jgi:hypothetical protein
MTTITNILDQVWFCHCYVAQQTTEMNVGDPNQYMAYVVFKCPGTGIRGISGCVKNVRGSSWVCGQRFCLFMDISQGDDMNRYQCMQNTSNIIGH